MCLSIYSFLQIVEEEAMKRIELLVKKRVEEELERRKDEIEREIAARIAEKQKQMELEMMLELENRKAKALEAQRKREVQFNFLHQPTKTLHLKIELLF